MKQNLEGVVEKKVVLGIIKADEAAGCDDRTHGGGRDG